MTTPNDVQPRVFVVGANRIIETERTAAMTNEQVRQMLKAQYPEVANATITERVVDSRRVVEFLPQPGRKG